MRKPSSGWSSIAALALALAWTAGLAACSDKGDAVSAADPEPGIALGLAEQRAASIRDLRYGLSLSIPETAGEPVTGTVDVQFSRTGTGQPLVLDFAPGAASIKDVRVGGKPAGFKAVNGHIVIPADYMVEGANTLTVEFQAGDASLNRNPDFLYALFVPARAHLAFPCFDQPDLKARYTLELTVPKGWSAATNGAEVSRFEENGKERIRYAETQPISTYLFTFAAGRFQQDRAERNGRTFTMFHRETDAKKSARNRDAIFDLHASALKWLEEYTGIPYPFGKFDFVLIPSFQFGGMEHPGAIYYNASSLMLDESATENQHLGRASVIAHETAHMWFGDLVTMRWFNDVWMKEVFANFMAAKIVNPSFPKVNHELRFLTAHYPSAYGVDRTDGTHPIRQDLANLNEAGSLYGAIIYQKAPIVMRQLEKIVGIEPFREGLREYLKEFAFGNATWPDLIRVLDSRTDLDLVAWSRVWVEQAGRPRIRTEVIQGPTPEVRLVQSDSQEGRNLQWVQQIEVLAGSSAAPESMPLTMSGERTIVPWKGSARPDFILPTGGGLAYGEFVLDDATRNYLLAELQKLNDPVARGAAWVTLWDEVLNGRVTAKTFLETALRSLPAENTEQLVSLILRYTDEAFWRFTPEVERSAIVGPLEAELRRGIARSTTSGMKSTYFSALRSVAATPDSIAFLERAWRRQEKIPGLTFSEPDEATLALELAVRSLPNAQAILDEQLSRFENADRKARFEFVMPALSADERTRGRFFESLIDVKNRRREPWVIEGLRYLHHPLRGASRERMILPSLNLLVEIQKTGDIFFPRNWMDATLGWHHSKSAADVVRKFLAERPDYPVRLRRIILQSADDLFRAAG